MKYGNLALVFGLLAAIAAIITSPAWSNTKSIQPPSIPFLNMKVFPIKGTYVVLKDANVRSQPATKGPRIGRRKRGDRVKVVGKAKGHWLAIRDNDGKDFGFIYRSILMPVIDGSLAAPLTGELTLPNAQKCNYTIQFQGKTKAEGQIFEFADYRVRWECKLENGPFKFNTPMFLTEGPYRGTSIPTHQITIDILGLAESMENVFSTHALWDRVKSAVIFDSITLKQFSRVPQITKVPADDLEKALHGTVKIAASAWNGPLWKTIIRRQRNTEN